MSFILFMFFINIVHSELLHQYYRRIENKSFIVPNAITFQRANIGNIRSCVLECTKSKCCTAVAISKTTTTCKLMVDLMSESDHLDNDNDWDVYEGIYHNVAIGKITSQSSTHINGYGKGGYSYNAVDNKFATDMSADGNYGCAHTERDDHPWWMVDLGSSRLIHTVKMLNREGYDGRLSNIMVTIGNAQSNMGICGEHIPAVGAGEILTVTCRNGLITGQYVKVQLQKEESLSLCEVMVMTRK